MRIAIEALGIHTYGGGRSATLNLLEALLSMDSQNEYLLLLSEHEPTLEMPANNVRQMIAPSTNRFGARVWAQRTLPALSREFDLVHFMKDLGVFGLAAPSITTVYDMATVLFPELYPWIDVLYWRTVQRKMLRETDQVVAISHNTARDIAQIYGIPLDEIRVIYPACANHFRQPTVDEIAEVRAIYQLPAEFVVHVGRIDRKKNLSALVRAYARCRELSGFAGQLVFVGAEYPKSRDEEIYHAIAECGIEDQVLFTGPVPDDHVVAIYGAATVAVLSSLYEGFCIAALEAMRCGTPFISNRAGAVTEVVGDAAITINIRDLDQLINALILVTSQPGLRQTMQRRGLEEAEKFSWQHSARQTLNLYEEVAGR